MDLIGEIVEHDVQEPEAPKAEVEFPSTGFPVLKPLDFSKGPSRFRRGAQGPSRKVQPKPKTETPVTEAARIHDENLKKISALTDDEISKEREELLQALDPKVIQSLLKRTEKRAADEHENHHHAQGYDGWIGGGKNGVTLPHLDSDDVNRALGIKSVRFAEEEQVKEAEQVDHEEAPEKADEALSEIAPEGYQIVESEEEAPEVHFPRPKRATEDPDLDIDAPDFFDKLHEKYYPDLPKETSKLQWMTQPMPEQKITTYEAISDMRFDFHGNLIDFSKESQDIPTHLGLHHHSDNPQLAGYTLAELVHFTRSVVPTQRCLGIQVLGRILHKLGLHKYNIAPIPEGDEDTIVGTEFKQMVVQFEEMMWDHIEDLRVIDSLTEAADELRTRNLLVRNYAIEALWLWKEGGGRSTERRVKTEEEAIAEELQNM